MRNIMSIIEYIRGRRHGEEAQKLERESMRDPFLSDAIDGFDSVNGNHVERIEDIRRQIIRKAHRNNRWFTYAGIAASLVFIISVGGYFLLNETQDHFIAQSDYLNKSEAASEQIAAEPVIINEEERIVAKEKFSDKIVMQEEQRASEERREPVLMATPVQNAVAKSKVIAVTEKEAVEDEKNEAPEILMIVEDKKDILSYEDDKELISYEDAIDSQEKAVKPDSFMPQASMLQEQARGLTAAKEINPEPMIGWKAYKKYLTDSLRVPSVGECAKLNGTVVVTFNIDENGHPLNFAISIPLCPDADAEAIRLIKEGCLWKNKGSMKIKVKF